MDKIKTIIYQSGDPEKGTTFIKVGYIEKEPPSPHISFKIAPRAFLLGILLGVFLLFTPFIFLEVKYHLNSWLRKEVSANGEVRNRFAETIQQTDLVMLQPINPEFSLVIPKIDINAEIFANVEPGNKELYEAALKKGIAHAAGSYLPGQGGTIYLFGHSTDYVWNISQFNAVFYLLKELEVGDQINLFYQGKRYLYQVSDKKMVPAADLSYLKPQKGQEELVLQTCWPPGTTWQRLLVIAQPINL